MSKITEQRNKIGQQKTARIPIKIVRAPRLEKPSWIKMQLPNSNEFQRVKSLLKKNQLNTTKMNFHMRVNG